MLGVSERLYKWTTAPSTFTSMVGLHAGTLIAPFRKYSRGYTGQNKVALRSIKFSLDDLYTQKERVKKLIDQDLNGLGAFETTQYYRGQLYTYVDFLLQGGPYTEEQIDAINDFIYHVLRLIITWLKKLPKLLPLHKVNSDLFLIDENIAILQSAYEFLDLLRKIFACCHRCMKYYLLHDKNPVSYDKPVTKDFGHLSFEGNRKKDEDDIDIDEVKEIIMTRKNLVFGQFLNFMNYFAEFGGFEAILDFLRIGNESQEDKAPLEMLALITAPFRNCNSIFNEGFALSFVNSIKEILVTRLRTMTEKELKEIDKESVGRVLLEMKDFFTISLNEQETAELIESNQLNIALRFLRSTYLEKRLKGISEIKTMIERIEWAERQEQFKEQKYGRRMIDDDGWKVKSLSWLRNETLRDWLLQNNILEIVFGENTHTEIVKRSACVLKFLAKQGALPIESVELIWKCQLGKHEEMVRVVYHTIQELVPNIELPCIDAFYSKLQQIPQSAQDEKYLSFLKEFTVSALENYYDHRSNEGNINEEATVSYEQMIMERELKIINNLQSGGRDVDPEFKHYGLPIFWEIIQDKYVQVGSDVQELALSSLIDILKANSSQPLKLHYLFKGLENLTKGESLVQSILLVDSIIHSFPIYDDQRLTRRVLVLALDKQLSLMNQLIRNIVIYQNQVREKVKSLAEKKRPVPEDVANYVFVGKYSHDKTLKALLSFLEFIIETSDQQVSLGNANIDQLWQIFVQQPNFTLDQTQFLSWINKTREDIADRLQESFLLTDSERKYFFTKILCSPTYMDFQKISQGQVKCFQKYFKVINKQEGYLEVLKRKMRVVEFDKLVGMDTLWHIAIETENEKSREESMDLLVDLHLKFDQSVTQDEQKKIWSNFIDHCMKNLESENEALISNTLQLISRFLDRYEGKKTLKPEFKQSQFTNLQPLNITVLNRSDQQRKQVHISYFQSIGYLRQKIAEAFDLQINEFTMQIKNGYVDPDEDDERYIKDIGLIQSVIISKNPVYNPENHPKYLISSSQANYEKLFYLLSKDRPQLIETTWELLSKLPVNAKLQQEIRELNGVMENKSNWEKILDPKSTNKLLYSLKIINSQNQNKKDQKVLQWRFKFVQMGGFTHLLRTFINLDIKSIDTNLTLKCVELLIIILYEFLITEKDLNKLVLDQKDAVIQQSIHLVDMISDYTVAVEKKRGQSYEDIQKRIQQNKQKKNKYKSYMAGNKGVGGAAGPATAPEKNEDEEDHESQEFSTMQTILKQFTEDAQIVQNLFRFLQFTIFQYDQSAVVAVLGYPRLEEMLEKSMVRSENLMIRQHVMIKMKEIICMRSKSVQMKQMIKIIEMMVFKIQPITEKYENRSQIFYDYLTQIIESLDSIDLLPLQFEFESMIQQLANFILNRDFKEKNTQDQDHLLSGKMKLLKSLLQKFPHLKHPIGSILTDHLIHTCLFEVPQGGTSKSSPKCKNQSSRANACRLLAVLCRDCLPNLDLVLNYMQKFNQNPSWRTNKEHDWNISLMDSEKSSTGYVGLKNLGCICYMNSLFQQLFMIQGLRNDILSVKEQTAQEKEESMLYQLQLLFAGLLKSEKQYVSPKGFCHAFKDWEGQPTNVLEQMDVEEFFNMLMDRIESGIKGSPQQNTIQYHFGGKFASEMICKGCPHKYERSEPYLSLSIPVKNKKSIQESLGAFIQGEMLEGDNAYLCEKCDKKVDTLKRTCLKKLPRYLIIALRRFEFDYDKMIRVKVNDYCEFPIDLDMEPYTQEGLARREKMQKMKEEKNEGDDQDDIEMDPLKYPKEYYEYSLSGIVVHSGTADSGHYYSFIKDREHPESGKWYEMNDHIVRDFDPADIPQECFGGEDTFQGYNMMQMKSMKWRNAYLLFYERKTPCDVASEEESEKVQTTSNTANSEDIEMKPTDVRILSEIEEKIAYENQKYWQNRFLFGNEYHEFVYDLSLNWNTSYVIPRNHLTKNNDFHLVNHAMPKDYDKDSSIQEPTDVKLPIPFGQQEIYEESVFKYAAGFYLTILQRAQNKNYIPQMINLLKSYINKSAACAHWLLTEFCNYQLLEEMFLQCGSKEMRKFTAGLIYCAMLKVYPVEKDYILDYWKDINNPNMNKSVIANLALVLVQNIFKLKQFIGNCTQYFQLLARISSLGPEIKEFLLRSKFVGRLMEFYFDEVSPHKEYFRDFRDINPIYKEKPDIGLPTQIDRKQISQFQEILERRRMKQLADAIPKYKYLFEAVSNCVKAYKNGDGINSPYQTDQVVFEGLQQQERDLYIPDSKFLKRVFQDGKKNRAIVALSTGYIHFAWTEKEAFAELLGVIQNGLLDYDFDDLKPFLVLIQFLLKNPGGDPSENRFEHVMQTFLETVKMNLTYYKFMEAIFEFIFKITSRQQSVRDWFKNRKSQWQFLVEWAEQARFPISQMETSMRLYKRRGQMQLHQQYLKNEAYRNQAIKEARNRRLEQLIKDQVPDLSTEIDVDTFDMQDYKFVVGEELEIYHRRQDKLTPAQVEQVLDEIIQVKALSYNQQAENYQQQSALQWVSCDTDKILPPNTWKSQYRVKMIEYFQSLIDRQRAQVSQNTQMRQGGDANVEMNEGRMDSSDDNDSEPDLYN